MPRLFDAPRRRYTYAVLISLAMSLAMSITMDLIKLGISLETLHRALIYWPLAFIINLAYALVFSPLLRRLTVAIWPERGA